MNGEAIKKLAEQRAKCAEVMQAYGMMNSRPYPNDEDKRISVAAAYRLAQDAFDRADADYRTAIAQVSTEDLIALSRGDDGQKV